MKFTSKNQYYNSNRPDRGTFENPFVKTTRFVVDTEQKQLIVHFKFAYIDHNGIEQKIEESKIVFTDAYSATTIDDGSGNEVEIVEHITNGGSYEKSRIMAWGRPDYNRVQEYFDTDNCFQDLEFKEQPLKQLAIDWVKQAVIIENLPLEENFEYEQPLAQ